MAFQFETDYDLETVTAMAKGLRKTLRKKRSKRVHLFAAVVIALGLLVLAAKLFLKQPLGGEDAVTLIAVLAVIFTGIFEDRLNAYAARRRLLPGTQHASTIFEEDCYTVKTSAAESKWQYDKPLAVAETKRYFIFALSKDHVQAFDKAGLSGGSLDDFRAFVAEKTGLPIQTVK